MGEFTRSRFLLNSNGSLILRTLRSDESGQDLIEYALIAALIGLGTVAAMSTLASNIATSFSNVGSQLTNAI
jgi:pilus assembly protein Flp/PilA